MQMPGDSIGIRRANSNTHLRHIWLNARAILYLIIASPPPVVSVVIDYILRRARRWRICSIWSMVAAAIDDRGEHLLYGG